jgi:hypothetical protein
MATSQHSAIRAALKTVFTNAGHKVFSYNPGTDRDADDFVYFHEVTASQDWFDLSGKREETLIVNGTIRTVKSGAGDEEAKDAEDAALAVLDDLETSLAADATLSDAGFQVELIGPNESEVYPMDGYRECQLRFVVRATVIL